MSELGPQSGFGVSLGSVSVGSGSMELGWAVDVGGGRFSSDSNWATERNGP